MQRSGSKAHLVAMTEARVTVKIKGQSGAKTRTQCGPLSVRTGTKRGSESHRAQQGADPSTLGPSSTPNASVGPRQSQPTATMRLGAMCQAAVGSWATAGKSPWGRICPSRWSKMEDTLPLKMWRFLFCTRPGPQGVWGSRKENDSGTGS